MDRYDQQIAMSSWGLKSEAITVILALSAVVAAVLIFG